jgi:hypothetical protein
VCAIADSAEVIMTAPINVASIVIPSAHRTMTGVKPEKMRRVFELQARLLLDYVRKGQADHAEIVDQLQAMAEEHGFVSHLGQGTIQAIMAEAMEAPSVDDDPKPAPPGVAAPRIVLTLPEFLATLKPPDYLVDGLFQRGYFYSLTALTGAGKTAVALLLSVAVADPERRWKFGGHEVEHGRVVYITRENPDDVKGRLIGMASKLEFEPEELARSFLVVQDAANLEKEMERIRREIEVFGDVALIIVDTSAAFFMGDAENDSTQMLNHARTQRRLTDLPGRPCVISLNHPIKGAASPEQLKPRGGGAYLNETDGNFTLWAHDDKLSDLSWTGKLRGPDFEKVTFRMVTITTTKFVDTKGRMMPTVMASAVSDEDIADAEGKSKLQENLLLKKMCDLPEASLADLAVACGWMLPGKNGEPDKPYKSLVVRVMERLKGDDLVKKKGRHFVVTTEGKIACNPTSH